MIDKNTEKIILKAFLEEVYKTNTIESCEEKLFSLLRLKLSLEDSVYKEMSKEARKSAATNPDKGSFKLKMFLKKVTEYHYDTENYIETKNLLLDLCAHFKASEQDKKSVLEYLDSLEEEPAKEEQILSSGDSIVASVKQRIQAFCVDEILMWLFSFLIFISIDRFKIGPDEYLLYWPVRWFFYVLFCEHFWGRTIGHYAMGMRVVNQKDYGKPSFVQIFLRNILKWFFCLKLFVGGLVFLFSQKSKTLHDALTGTQLIMVDESKAFLQCSIDKYIQFVVLVTAMQLYGIYQITEGKLDLIAYFLSRIFIPLGQGF